MVGSEKVEKVIRSPDELPAGWQKTTLAEVAEIIMGQSPSSQYYNSDGQGLPFFQGKAEFGELYPKPVKWCSQPNKVAQKDDVLMSVRAPVGPTNLAISECCIGRGLAAIRPRDGVPSRYVLYYLRSIESGIDALGTGTTFKAISGGILRSIPIPIAPAAQQDRIVAEIEKQFSRLDEAVANLKRVKANLKRYKASVLKAAVEGKLTEDWRKQHPDVEPASKLLERILAERRAKWSGRGKYKEPDAPDTTGLPPLPKGWTWARLEQLGVTFGGLTKNPKRAKFTRTLPYLRVANIYANELRLDEIERIGVQDSELDKLLLCKGDLLIVEGNGSKSQIGRLAIWDGSIDPCVHQNHLIKVRLVVALMNKWILFWLLSPAGRHFIEEVSSSTSGLYTLSVNKVGDLPIIVPSLAEQGQIIAEVERRLSVIVELETAVEANLKRADRLRQSVLLCAFEGKLVPQNASDELASAFLSRLRETSALKDSLQPKDTRKPGGTTMPKSKAEHSGEIGRMNTKSLYQILRDSDKRLTPEELFANAGFGSELIDEFYEELKRETQAGRILQERPNNTAVYLKAISNANR